VPERRILKRLARNVALAVVVAWLIYTLASWFLAWNPADAGAYYDAAQRLRDGQPLYPAVNPEAHEVYRYAPWFAFAWIPVTAIPRDVALHAWSLLMLSASLVAVWPLLRRPTWASVILAGLCAQVLIETAMFGNAHPLVVAMLSLTITRRSGPVWVGVATSLKLVPLLFAIVWLLRGEWRKALVATVTAVVLWLPALAFDLSHYVASPGTGLLSLYAVSPWAWAVAAAASAAWLGYTLLTRSRLTWTSAAMLMFLGPPRVATSYLGFIVPAVELTTADKPNASTSSGRQESFAR
jgi:hypothetical protein